MPRRKLKLKVISSVPCTQPWTAMKGTNRERHCEVCDKYVHNFAAMSRRQIEELIREKNGHVCARRVYRADGSLMTLDDSHGFPIAAGIVLASSLMLPLSLAAQSASAGEGPPARLSGQILKSDSSGPMPDAFVALLANHQIVASAHTNENGDFEIKAPPGTYDIAFGSKPSDTVRILSYQLQPGEQKLDALPILPQQTSTVIVEANMADYALVGAMTAVIGRPHFFWYFFRHPILFTRSLRHES
jgi:hypothetical protein